MIILLQQYYFVNQIGLQFYMMIIFYRLVGLSLWVKETIKMKKRKSIFTKISIRVPIKISFMKPWPPYDKMKIEFKYCETHTFNTDIKKNW